MDWASHIARASTYAHTRRANKICPVDNCIHRQSTKWDTIGDPCTAGRSNKSCAKPARWLAKRKQKCYNQTQWNIETNIYLLLLLLLWWFALCLKLHAEYCIMPTEPSIITHIYKCVSPNCYYYLLLAWLILPCAGCSATMASRQWSVFAFAIKKRKLVNWMFLIHANVNYN